MKRLFLLISWWRDSVAVEKFKFPKTVSQVENNITRLQDRVIKSKNSDWYVPPSSFDVDDKYLNGSLTEEPNLEDYDECYTFGMSIGACVMMSPYGYCYLPRGKRYIIKDCSIQETFGVNGVVTNINEYKDYLEQRGQSFETAEHTHNQELEEQLIHYSKKGVGWVHEKGYLDSPERYYFEQEELYDPVKFITLDEIYSKI